jgi:hypothetical protein
MMWPRCITRCGRRAELNDLLCKECRLIADNAPYMDDPPAEIVEAAKALFYDQDAR